MMNFCKLETWLAYINNYRFIGLVYEILYFYRILLNQLYCATSDLV